MPKVPSNNNPTFRNALITLFRFDNDPSKIMDRFNHENSPIKYAIWQLEIAPTTQTPHIQMYAEMHDAARLHKWKSTFGETAHIEPRRGTQKDAIKYCSKDETRKEGPWELFKENLKGQGSRTDLEEIKGKLDSGKPLSDIANEHFKSFVLYHKSFSVYSAIRSRPRDFKTEVILCCGVPKSGKTFYANQEAQRHGSIYWKSRNNASNEWWDQYDGQDSVIFDDFYGWIKADNMLRIMDAYPHQVEYKGGSRQFNSKYLFITSNTLPMSWYTNQFVSGNIEFAAFIRRIGQFILFWFDSITDERKMQIFTDYDEFEDFYSIRYPDKYTLLQEKITQIKNNKNTKNVPDF